MLKTAVLGYAIITAEKMNMNQADTQKFVEEMRFQIMMTPEIVAINTHQAFKIN